VQGAAEAHIVTWVAEGDAPDWGCDVVWTGKKPTEEESARHLANCVAVFGVVYRLSEEDDLPTDEVFLKMVEAGNVYMDDEADEVRTFLPQEVCSQPSFMKLDTESSCCFNSGFNRLSCVASERHSQMH
jgi:hypothetical protein